MPIPGYEHGLGGGELSRKEFDADQFTQTHTNYPGRARAINIPPNIPIARRDPGFPRAGVSLFARARPRGQSRS
jgi:hypothetical protein